MKRMACQKNVSKTWVIHIGTEVFCYDNWSTLCFGHQSLRRLKQKLNEALETLQTLPYFEISDSVIELRNNYGIKNTNGAQVCIMARREQANLQQEGQWLYYIILYNIISLHYISDQHLQGFQEGCSVGIESS